MSESDRIHRLLKILEAEERIYLELRDLLQHERELMVRLDAPSLVEVAREKEVLAAEARLVEESRQSLALELAAETGIDTPKPTLSQLCAALGPGRGSADLREAHTRMVVLASVVRELLDANAAFAGDHLNRVRSTLQLLGRLVPAEASYAPGRGTESTVAVGQLVRRAV